MFRRRSGRVRDPGSMNRRGRGRLMWIGLAVLAGAFLYFSESAMTWLRVTLHGR
jgi:hypothetical protein